MEYKYKTKPIYLLIFVLFLCLVGGETAAVAANSDKIGFLDRDRK